MLKKSVDWMIRSFQAVIHSPRVIFNKIVENLDVFFFIFLFLTIFVFIIWFFGTVVYPSQGNAVQRVAISDESGIAFDVLAPKKLQQAENSQVMEVIFLENVQTPVEQTLLVTFTTSSPYLFFVDPVNDRKTNSVSLSVSTKKQNPISVSIIHARNLPGWIASNEEISVECILSSPASPGQIKSACLNERIEMLVESKHQAAIRNVSSKLEITFMLALAGAIGSFFGLVLNQAEKRRKAVLGTRDRFYRAIREQNLGAAKEAFQSLQDAKEYLPETESIEISTLMAVAQGNLAPEIVNQFEATQITRPEESAGAVICAAYNPEQDAAWNFIIFVRMLEQFPLDKIESTDLREKVTKLKAEYKYPESLQPMIWPEQPGAQPKLVSPQRADLKSPYTHEQAEAGKELLFSKSSPLFWTQHELYKKLEEATPTNTPEFVHLVVGDAGTGKSAFALALGVYLPGSRISTFAAYLPGFPTVNQVQRTILHRLLDFILMHPTFLVKIGHYRMDLLAVMLVTYLDRNFVLAELERFEDPGNWRWIKEATEKEKETWKKISISQLRLLRKSVESASPTFRLEDFPQAIANCLGSLGFMHFRLVFDLPLESGTSWYRETVLAKADAWRQAGWVLIAFSVQDPLPGATWPPQRIHRLTWSDQDLKKWIEDSWRDLNPYTPLKEFLPPGDLDMMISAAHGNPRCFIRIWDQLMQGAARGKITHELIQSICEAVKCF